MKKQKPSSTRQQQNKAKRQRDKNIALGVLLGSQLLILLLFMLLESKVGGDNIAAVLLSFLTITLAILIRTFLAYSTDKTSKLSPLAAKVFQRVGVTILIVCTLGVIAFIFNHTSSPGTTVRNEDIATQVDAYLTNIRDNNIKSAFNRRSEVINTMKAADFEHYSDQVQPLLTGYTHSKTQRVQSYVLFHRQGYTIHCYDYTGSVVYQDGSHKTVYAALRDGKAQNTYSIIDAAVFSQGSEPKQYSCKEYTH